MVFGNVLAAARSDETLREEYVPPVGRLFLAWFRFLATGFGSVFLLIPLVILITDPQRIESGLLAWAAIVALGLPLAALFAAVIAFAAWTNRPIVSVVAGVIGLTQGRETEVVSLSQCEWHHGNVSQMSVLTQVAVLNDPALILVLPDDRDGRPRRVAIGLNDETRELWEAFLRLSRTLERAEAVAPRTASTFLRSLVWFFLFPLTFLLCGLIGRLVGRFISFWIADRGVGQLVGVVILIYGTISTLMYAALFIPLRPVHIVPTRRPPHLQRKFFRQMFWGWLLTNTVFIALPFVFVANLSPLARGMGIVFSYVWAIAAGYDFGRRISRSDFEDAVPIGRDSANPGESSPKTS